MMVFIIHNPLAGQGDLVYAYASDAGDTRAGASITNPQGIKMLLCEDSMQSSAKIWYQYFRNAGTYVFSSWCIGSENQSDTLRLEIKSDGIASRIEIHQSVRGEARHLISHLSLTTLYQAPPGIVLSAFLPRRKYQIPVWQISNHTPDTILGEYLPGYFWGTISTIPDTQGKFYRITSPICLTFEPRPPLYPDSATWATLGALNEGKLPGPGTYVYELRYTRHAPKVVDHANIQTPGAVWHWYKTSFYYVSYSFSTRGGRRSTLRG